jgi:hypothetical protein
MKLRRQLDGRIKSFNDVKDEAEETAKQRTRKEE